MKPPRGTFLDDLRTYLWGELSQKPCPYCGRGFVFKQWRERDRDTGGHDPCPD